MYTCCNNLYFSICGACPKLSERNHDNIWLHKKKENNQDFTRKSCEIDIKRKYSWHESGNLKPAQRDEKETHTKLKDESCSIQIIKTNNIPSQKKETSWISWKRIAHYCSICSIQIQTCINHIFQKEIFKQRVGQI